jgi:3-hydroxy acid dehydrogenase / malonic semialdehyde reductase
MKIAITGTSSGIGKHLAELLTIEHDVIELTRTVFDLDFPDTITDINFVDILINCAGHDLGGKVEFTEHAFARWSKILNTNLISAMALCQHALRHNPGVMIINITSTNNDRFYPGDLVYSLSKKSLEVFGHMLQEEYPFSDIREVRIGLTKTEFNKNRHKLNHKLMDTLYDDNCYLEPLDVAEKICMFMCGPDKFIRIQP